MNFCILGSNPKLSLLELQKVLPNTDFTVCGTHLVLFDNDTISDQILMNLLGGTVKLGQILLKTDADKLNPELIAQTLAKAKSDDSTKISLDFGWTIYHAPKSLQKKLEKYPIRIKKELKQLGFSCRWVTSKNHTPLTPAAVAKCKLTNKPNADLCVCAVGKQIIIGRTTQVQNADAWSLRDFGRPIRDSLNGMLPPKLARILLNLANINKNQILLDPFCGSGTILMEAALATPAKQIIGSDIEDKQVASSQTNIDWLIKERILRPDDLNRFHLFVSDVKQITDHLKPKSIDAVVTEGWLGPPLKGNESQNTLNKNAEAVTSLWLESLSALKPLLKRTSVLIITIPQFRTSHAQAIVDLEPYIEELGYQSENINITYSRPNQFVERKIMILHIQ